MKEERNIGAVRLFEKKGEERSLIGITCIYKDIEYTVASEVKNETYDRYKTDTNSNEYKNLMNKHLYWLMLRMEQVILGNIDRGGLSKDTC